MHAAVPAALDAVLQHPGIWRRSASAQPHVRALSTGLPDRCAAARRRLAVRCAERILFGHDGIGELALLMPALAKLTRRRQRVVFVAPPYIPYAPALVPGLDLRYVVQINPRQPGAWSSGSVCVPVRAAPCWAGASSRLHAAAASAAGGRKRRCARFPVSPGAFGEQGVRQHCGCSCTPMPNRSISKS